MVGSNAKVHTFLACSAAALLSASTAAADLCSLLPLLVTTTGGVEVGEEAEAAEDGAATAGGVGGSGATAADGAEVEASVSPELNDDNGEPY